MALDIVRYVKFETKRQLAIEKSEITSIGTPQVILDGNDVLKALEFAAIPVHFQAWADRIDDMEKEAWKISDTNLRAHAFSHIRAARGYRNSLLRLRAVSGGGDAL